MAIFLKQRNEYLFKTSHKYLWFGVLLCVFLLTFGTLTLIYKDLINQYPYVYGAIIIISILILGITPRLDKFLMRKFNNYFNGNDGEIEVEKVLSELPDKFQIIPDLQKPTGDNIDFVVVGPTGIFALEVKTPTKHSKIDFDGRNLTFNGRHGPKDPLNQTIGNATALGTYLQQQLANPLLFVKPVLVFASPQNLHFGLHKVDRGPQVICKEYLVELLTRKENITFSSAEVARIAETVKEFK